MTIAIILSAHGFVSEKLLSTTEMIIGKQKNVAWTELLPNENIDDLIKKYNIQLLSLNTVFGVLFLVDTWGGTPFNAAQKIILNKKNYDIVTGINVPMLIEIFMERDNIKTIKELVYIAIKSGSRGIKSVNYAFYNNTKTEIIDNTQDTIFNKQSNQVKRDISHSHMEICLARIDDRLIHGQVVTRWAKEYKITRIIVVNNDISKDTIRKNLLTQVTPPGITAHVISINKAIRVYNNPKYASDKVIMLFTNPEDILFLIQGGIPIKSVNIGGMSFSKEKKQITDAISISTKDIESFEKLDQYGIELEIRKVPSDSALSLMKLLKNIR